MAKELQIEDTNSLVTYLLKDYNKLDFNIKQILSFDTYCKLALQVEDLRRIDLNNACEGIYSKKNE